MTFAESTATKPFLASPVATSSSLRCSVATTALSRDGAWYIFTLAILAASIWPACCGASARVETAALASPAALLGLMRWVWPRMASAILLKLSRKLDATTLPSGALV